MRLGLQPRVIHQRRGTLDRSVHGDALSSAAWYLEATPPPLKVFVDPAELPLCTALIVEEVSPAFHHRR